MPFIGRLCLLIICCSNFLYGNRILDYPITNFGNNVGQSNAIFQNDVGDYYCASENGLYQLISGKWQSIQQQKEGVTLINQFSDDQIIFAGPGYFSSILSNSDGTTKILQLSKNLPDNLAFSDAHKLVSHADKAYLHTDNRLLEIGNEIVDFGFKDIEFISSLNGDLFVQRNKLGLFLYVGNDFKKLNGSEPYSVQKILEIVNLPQGRHLIIYENEWVIYDGGYFSNWTSSAIRNIMRLEVVAVSSNANGIFVGTANNGIHQFNFQGGLIRRISREEGLTSEKIKSLYSDKDQNLWCASENGVDLIRSNSALTLLKSKHFPMSLPSHGTAINIVEDELFLGTTMGVYKAKMDVLKNTSNLRFREVQNARASIKHLYTIDNLCFSTGELGVNAIVNNTAYKISPGIKSNNLLELNGIEVLFESFEQGLNIYTRNQGKWRFANQLYGINEEISTLLQDNNGKIWVLGLESGIMELPFNEDLNTVEVVNHDVENIQVEEIFGLFLINGKPILSTSNGIFEYGNASNNFKANEKYNLAFGKNNRIKHLYQDVFENIWFISETEVGVLKVDDNGIEKVVNKQIIPDLLTLVNNQKYSIKELDDDHLIFGAKDGFVILTKSKIKTPKALDIRLLKSESLDLENKPINQNNYSRDSQVESIIENAKNSDLRLSFISNYVTYESLVEYKYRLNDGEWNNWQNNNVFNIPFPKGDNSFEIMARIGEDLFSNTITIPITINSSWYTKNVLRNIFYFLMGILFISLFSIFYTRQKRKLNQIEKETEEQLGKIELLEHQKLELQEKNDLLSSKILSIPEEDNILSVLKKFYGETENEELRKAVKKLIKKIKPEKYKQGDSLVIIEHPEFFAALKLKFPNLTKKDIKLCNYLRLKLSSKEIAPLLGISVRGVEISRYRLRKKLELSNDENLSKYLKNIYKSDV